MGKPLRVLILEDSIDDALLLVHQLERGGYEVTFEQVDCAAAWEAALERRSWDVVITDYNLPSFDGLAALRLFKAKNLDLPYIVVSGTIGENTAVEMMKAGAHDYLMKSNMARLLPAVERELREMEVRRQRKHAEMALRESETRYRLIANNVGDVIWTVDPNLHFTFISPSIFRMRGYTVEEAMRQTLADILTPESLEQALQLYRNEMSAPAVESYDPNRTVNAEWRQYHKDGSILWTENELSLLRDDQQRIVGIVGVTRDISQRKRMEEERSRLEEQLRQSQKMEAIGRLAGGVAHDFNNILTIIIGYSELLLGGLTPHHPSNQDLMEIRKAADRASTLTAQLLAFSRKQLIDPKVVDLNALLAEFNMMLKRLVGEDVDYRFVPEERLGHIKVDPGQMEQVLVNLVVNARDAMADGGVLAVETANVTIDESYQLLHAEAIAGEYAMITVSDTGCGMDATVLGHLFEPFFTTKEKGKGTGLGLSTVYGIVKQNGGFINIYSEVGVGTTFKIYFPLVQDELEVVSISRESEIPTGTETILVVEDEEMVGNLAKKALEKFGYRVFVADSRDEAHRRCRDHPGPIELLLTDVVLPGMNGRMLYKNLHPLRPDIKVIFMSGYAENVIGHRGLLEKGIHFIQKPFTVEALARKVRHVLDLA